MLELDRISSMHEGEKNMWKRREKLNRYKREIECGKKLIEECLNREIWGDVRKRDQRVS